jgi:hypothetical protein
MVGDSLASGTGTIMRPNPYIAVAAAAGFTDNSKNKVIDVAETALAQYGQPETMLVMSGVGDTPAAETAEILAGMEAFRDNMEARGIRLIWIAEPGYSFEEQLEPLSQWMFAQDESIDCRIHAGSSYDGVHPVSYRSLSQCVNARLAEMGVTFYVQPPP